MACTWIAHIHCLNGDVREIVVATDSPGRKKEAVEKVCRAAQIESPNDPSIKGMIISEDRLGGWRAVLGEKLRGDIKKIQEEPKKEDNVVHLVPTNRSGFTRYKVCVYVTKSQRSPITSYLNARSAMEALMGVLGKFNVDHLDKAGEYLVYELNRNGDELRLRRGFYTVPETLQPESGAVVRPPLALLPKPQNNEPVHCCSTVEACSEAGICVASQCAIKQSSIESIPVVRPAPSVSKFDAALAKERTVRVRVFKVARRSE